jgi:hypothetical protein
VSIRIAFDLDGVLADMESALVRQAEIVFGEAMTKRLLDGHADASRPPEQATDVAGDATAPAETAAIDPPPVPRLHMTVRQERRLWRHVQQSIPNFWETLDEVEPGTVAQVAKLALDRRWEVIFLTKRPETAGATAQVQSQRWLESKGFALPSVYVVQGSRGRVADALALDIVIDDRPENCLDVVVDSKARAILIWRDQDGLLPGAAKRLGVGVVKTMAECLNILTQVDGADESGSGIVTRVMRLLRLKEAAPA